MVRHDRAHTGRPSIPTDRSTELPKDAYGPTHPPVALPIARPAPSKAHGAHLRNRCGNTIVVSRDKTGLRLTCTSVEAKSEGYTAAHGAPDEEGPTPRRPRRLLHELPSGGHGRGHRLALQNRAAARHTRHIHPLHLAHTYVHVQCWDAISNSANPFSSQIRLLCSRARSQVRSHG